MIRIFGLVAAFAAVVATACVTVPSSWAAEAPMARRDLVQEEANRAMVLKFYDTVFNAHRVAEGAKVIVDGYIQHNPHVPNGNAPFVAYFTDLFEKYPQSRARVVRSAVDGDLVYLHVHATNGPTDAGQAIVDIFRVRGGRIVEHWNVIQSVPSQSANDNTMF